MDRFNEKYLFNHANLKQVLDQKVFEKQLQILLNSTNGRVNYKASLLDYCFPSDDKNYASATHKHQVKIEDEEIGKISLSYLPANAMDTNSNHTLYGKLAVNIDSINSLRLIANNKDNQV